MTKRVRVFAAALALAVVACSSASPAPATTTTTTTVAEPGVDGDTTTTLVANDGGEGFRTRTPGVLVIGSERLTPPWYTGPGAGEITGGFEYRLAQEIGSRLGIPVVKVVRTSLVLMMTGQDCRCDIIISSVTITDGRARALDLSEPYVDADQALLVRHGTTVPSLTSAATLHIGAAIRDPAALDVIRNKIKPEAPPTVVVDDDEAVRALAAGKLDAVVLDTPDALARALADPSLAVAGRVVTGEQYAVALSLGSPNTALVNNVIKDMRNDGTIDNLLTVYLRMQPSHVAVIPQ